MKKLKIKTLNLKTAFTLVELIVVVTILAILATIAFISFQGFARDARDSARLSDITVIKKALSVFETKNSRYPDPTNGTSIVYSGAEVWNQGTFGIDTKIELGGSISKDIVDPLTKSEYTYSLLNTKLEYQLGATLEGTPLAYNPSITNKANAAGDKLAYAYVTGNYNGLIAKVNTGSIDYILSVPTIISGDLTLIDIIEQINTHKLVYNGYTNLAYSYSGQINFTTVGETNLTLTNTGETNIVVFSGSLSTLTNPNNITQRTNLIENLQRSYTGTVIINTTNIATLLSQDTTTNNTTLYNYAVLLVNNNLGGDLNTQENILTGWRALDPNCKIEDIPIGTQIWAGCNSTLGTGIEWGKKIDGSTGTIDTCYDYDENNNASDPDCTILNPIMSSNASAKLFFDLKQPDGENSNQDYEYDNIWGKFYTWEQALGTYSDGDSNGIIEANEQGDDGACPVGRHVPTDDEMMILENEINGSTCSTPSGGNFMCDGLGWNSQSGAKLRKATNLLKLPLSGSNNNGSVDGRGRYQYLWTSTEASATDGYLRCYYRGWSTFFRTSPGGDAYSDKTVGSNVRCIKD